MNPSCTRALPPAAPAVAAVPALSRGVAGGVPAGAAGALAQLRFAIASFVLLVAGARRRLGSSRARPATPARTWSARDLGLVFATGALGVTLHNLALNAGERSVNAGTASLLVGSSPVFAALLAVLFLGERPGARRIVAMALGFAGLSQGAFFALQKPLLARHPAREVASGAAWCGALGPLPFGGERARTLGHAPAGATAAAGYLGVFPGALAYFTWSHALARLETSRATATLYLVPALVLGFGWGRLGERPTALSSLGGMVALGGVALLHGRGRAAKVRAPRVAAPSSVAWLDGSAAFRLPAARD